MCTCDLHDLGGPEKVGGGRGCRGMSRFVIISSSRVTLCHHVTDSCLDHVVFVSLLDDRSEAADLLYRYHDTYVRPQQCMHDHRRVVPSTFWMLT